MQQMTVNGYTAHYRKDFNVPSGWPPRWRIDRIVRPDGSTILPTTYSGPRVPASFQAAQPNVKRVSAKVAEVVAWDAMTEAERVAAMAIDFDLF